MEVLWEEFDGVLAGDGLDPERMPMARLLNRFWAWLAEDATTEQREKLTAALWDGVADETDPDRPAGAPWWWSDDDGFTDAQSKDASLH